MNILFVASEVAPFIKTGGLADVAGSLPQSLVAQGHDVRVVLPLYEGIGEKWRNEMTFLGAYEVQLSWRTCYCGVFTLSYQDVTYYFLDNEQYFKRGNLYGYYDDGERYGFFCRGVIGLPAQLGWHPDVIHANDWQGALVPIYLLEAGQTVKELKGTKSVFTIHNIEYQGRYSRDILEDVFGLDKGYFHEEMLSFHGDINLMKGAIYASDYVTTVSPTYAEELQYAYYAHGLEGVIAANDYKITGILNGIDTTLYNPATDAGLDHCFTPEAMAGKAQCKAALQQACGLRVKEEVPIIACVSRLVAHKGFAMVTQMIDAIMELDVQMVVLGTGDWHFEQAFRLAEKRYPGRFSAQMMYSSQVSTMIYGGADLFLMPSISEPCGLSQMIAMSYGTVPVVRETGGLKDTVIPHPDPDATGFTFANASADDMFWVIREGVELYHKDKESWQQLQKVGMERDSSWKDSGIRYSEIYQNIT